MRPLKHIVATLALLSFVAASGQDLYDYRYYKRFEAPDTEVELEQPDSTATQVRLSAYRHDFRMLDYNLSFVRFDRRGASFDEQCIRLNGIEIEKISRTEALRLQLKCEDNDGIILHGNRAGGAFGNREYSCDTAYIEKSAIQLNLGTRNYTAGLVANTCNHLGKGWRLATDVSIRTGRDAHIRSIFTNAATLNASLTKRFGDAHSLSFIVLMSPTERGTRQSSTAEAFRLRNDNLYSPSWGYQNGKIRNSHVRRDFTPTLSASYSGNIAKNVSLNIALGATAGTRRYSMLEWFDASTPRPDNYRYMPSYFSDDDVAAIVEEAWRQNDTRYTQINFDELILQNRLSDNGAIYAIADRVERITRMQVHTAASITLGKRTSLSFGIDGGIDRSRRYKQMRDLLGAEYLTDIDYYLIDDDAFGNSLQNNMLTPSRMVRAGERFGYDYALCRRTLSAFGAVLYDSPHLHINAAIEAGYCDSFRRGFYQKELFADSSLGESAHVRLSPFAARLSVGYEISDSHSIEVAANACGNAPAVENMFLQADYNNRIIDYPTLRTDYAVEARYRYFANHIDLQATLFASLSQHDLQVGHLYDDISGKFADMVVSDIDLLRYGAEVEVGVRFAEHWRTALAVSAGRYRYAKNPSVSLYADTDNSIICNNIQSYMGDCTTGAPEVVATAEISYFNRGWGVNLNANYAGLRRVAPSYMRRTERVAYMANSPELLNEFIHQERLRDAFTLDASLSKTIYLSHFDKRIATSSAAPRFMDRHPRSRITLFLSVRNLLGNRNIVYNGYESSRMMYQWLGNEKIYRPQATRYLYAYPRTYLFMVKFAF